MSDKEWIENWIKENNLSNESFWKLMRIIIESDSILRKIIKNLS